MKRRDLLTASVASAAAAFVVAPAMAAEETRAHHGQAPHATMAAAAVDCVRTGDACVAHCIDSLATGDTSLAECAKRADELTVVCNALAKLASNNSPQLAAYSKTAAAICRDCEKECRKHADKHAVCKACAESCAACAQECERMA